MNFDSKPKCKGSIAIGTGCLECVNCAEQALKLFPRYSEMNSLYEKSLQQIEERDSNISRIDGKLEIVRGDLAKIAATALSNVESAELR